MLLIFQTTTKESGLGIAYVTLLMAAVYGEQLLTRYRKCTISGMGTSQPVISGANPRVTSQVPTRGQNLKCMEENKVPSASICDLYELEVLHSLLTSYKGIDNRQTQTIHL